MQKNSLKCNQDCCHYGEGCALGYPINGTELSNMPNNDSEEKLIETIKSDKFRKFWESKLKQTNSGYLSCFHKGCDFFKCKHLGIDDKEFMSKHYKEIMKIE